MYTSNENRYQRPMFGKQFKMHICIEVAYGKVPLRARAGEVAQPKNQRIELVAQCFSEYVRFDRSLSSNIFINVKNDAA